MAKGDGLIKSILHLILALAFPCLGWASTADDPVPLQYFGLHIHRADQGTAWPNIPFGSWRLWDAYVNWSQLEPRKGQWDFARLDRYVAMARLAKVDVLLPLANTPTWAAARPTERSGYQPGNASEPLLIDDWRNYVRAVGERYKGRIKLYEIWNEPNIKHHFSGTPEKMVELTCEAYKILKAIDPENRIVSPAASAGAKAHVPALDNFLAIGGKQCIDVVAHHFYVPNAGPEAMVPMIRQVRAVMQKNGIADKPLWNTETGWWISNNDGTPDHPMVATRGWKKFNGSDEGGSLVVRAFVLARSEGIDRFFWYSWDNPYGLGMREPASGAIKPMARYFGHAMDLLLNWAVQPCETNWPVWTCKLERPGIPPRWIAWSEVPITDWQVPVSMAVGYSKEIGNGIEMKITGGRVAITSLPVLLR